MQRSSNTGSIWTKSPSGLLLPDGTHSEILEHDLHTYAAVKAMAEEVKELYSLHKISIPPQSSLNQLIDAANQLSDSWILNEAESISMPTLLKAFHIFRISRALISLKSEPNIDLHLKKLTSGDLNLLDRKQSNAKDYLWEIELFSSLKNHGVNPKFTEPDLQVSMHGSLISFACKKIYSEKNFAKTLSIAVAQIERSKNNGIVAINIDELLPSQNLLNGNTHQSTNKILQNFNDRFINKHVFHLRKYLTSGRIISCIVSSSIIADVKDAPTRLNNVSQMTFWTIPTLSLHRQNLISEFYARLKRSEEKVLQPSL